MAAAARPGAWLRFAGDLLASADRVGQGRGVRRLHLKVLDQLGAEAGAEGGGRGWAGLVTRERGLGQRARQARGTTWAQIRSIVASRIQASPGLRRWWAAADRSRDRRQRQRHHHV